MINLRTNASGNLHIGQEKYVDKSMWWEIVSFI
jgi:hypothetical protein